MPDTDTLAKRLHNDCEEECAALRTECEMWRQLAEERAAALSAARAEAMEEAAQWHEDQEAGLRRLETNDCRRTEIIVHEESARGLRALAAGQGGENG